MRIIGGRLKGRTIVPPSGLKARPTTDFAKEGLFNTLSSEYDFEGLDVLDLFAGTGAISYEFASRGAGRVCSVEMSAQNSSFIRARAAEFGLGGINVVRQNVFDFLAVCKLKFDIIFADPPYALEGLETLPEKILSRDALNNGGYLILEHPGTFSFSAWPSFVKEKKYGKVHFSFFRPILPNIL